MLSSYAEVQKGGDYVWKAGAKVPSLRNRFLRLADQLLSGRLCISSMMIGATKVVVAISTRYMLTRMGVGPNGKSNTPILDYQLCQHEVFPLIAKGIYIDTSGADTNTASPSPQGQATTYVFVSVRVVSI